MIGRRRRAVALLGTGLLTGTGLVTGMGLLIGTVLVIGGREAAAADPDRARPVFRIGDSRITEASGIASGRVSPGVVYVQNDSGDVNRFFALNRRTGATAATVTVVGAHNVDWEDIATAPDGSGRPSVYLADVGDNGASRSEIQVYRVAEPHVPVSASDVSIRTAPAAVWRLRYPDGPVDAESLAVAPNGRVYLVTKSLGGATVYELPPRPDRSRVQRLRRVGEVPLSPTGTPNPFGVAGQLTATGASISADGALLALRTYSDAYVWRLTGDDVAAALHRPPVRLALPRQPQGEGICIVDGELLLDSEGRHSSVLAVALPTEAPPVRSSAPVRPTQAKSTPAPASASASPSVTPSPAVADRGRAGWLVTAIVAGAAAAVLAGWRLRHRRAR